MKRSRARYSVGKLFLKGLVVVIPLALTLAIIWWVASYAESLLGGLLARLLPSGWYIPGMGVIAAVAMTILVGVLSHILLFQKLFYWGEGVLNRLPLVKSIYSAIKDFIDYLSPENKASINKVVLVKIPGQHFEQVGFVTREDFSSFPHPLTVDDPVAVYLPMSYQIGGYTLFVPRSCITPLDMSFEEGMRLVLTGGVIKERESLPDGQAKSGA